jgi:hypothetical protein
VEQFSDGVHPPGQPAGEISGKSGHPCRHIQARRRAHASVCVVHGLMEGAGGQPDEGRRRAAWRGAARGRSPEAWPGPSPCSGVVRRRARRTGVLLEVAAGTRRRAPGPVTMDSSLPRVPDLRPPSPSASCSRPSTTEPWDGARGPSLIPPASVPRSPAHNYPLIT